MATVITATLTRAVIRGAPPADRRGCFVLLVFVSSASEEPALDQWRALASVAFAAWDQRAARPFTEAHAARASAVWASRMLK
jgi:hypothetical protein